MSVQNNDFKVTKYLNSLRGMRNQIQNLLTDIDNILNVIQEFKNFARNHRINLPKLPEVRIELDANSLEETKDRLRGYLHDIVFKIAHEAMPGLKDDSNECKLPDVASSYDRHLLLTLLTNLGKLWTFRDVLKYLRPCFSGYCEFIGKIQSDESANVVLAVANTIKNAEETVAEASLKEKLARCINDVISTSSANGCNMRVIESLGNNIRTVAALLKYLNDVKDATSLTNLSNFIVRGSCLDGLFEESLHAIQHLNQAFNLEELGLPKCENVDYLEIIRNKLQEIKSDYILKLQSIKSKLHKYSELITALTTSIAEKYPQSPLKTKLDELESAYGDLIRELSGDKINKERVRALVEDLVKGYQDLSTLVCNTLFPQLMLGQAEQEALMMLISRGGKVDFRELDNDRRRVVLELCDKGIIGCYASIGEQ